MSKIEDGLFNGEILYHRKVIKTEEELAQIKVERETKKREKAMRRKIQEDNSMNKDKLRDEHKQKSLAGMKNRTDRNEVDTPDDDDAAYYREEIGEDPDIGKFNLIILIYCYILFKHVFAELFSSTPGSRKRGYVPKYMHNKDSKRRKVDGDSDRKGGGKYGNKVSKYGGEKSKYDGGKSKFSGGHKSRFDNDDKPKFRGGSKSRFGNDDKPKFGGKNKSGGNSKFGSASKGNSKSRKGRK